MSWIKWILAYVFDCVHRRTTWPHRDRRGFDYVCCLECGKELPYSIRRMRIETRESLLADRNLPVRPVLALACSKQIRDSAEA
jgi:hypothetical protein